MHKGECKGVTYPDKKIDHSIPVKAGLINKLIGTYKPDTNLYYRESTNKDIKSKGFPC